MAGRLSVWLTLAGPLLLLSLLLLLLQAPGSVRARDLHKRSFAGLGCMGVYDKAKFARLDRVCEECYNLYREPELQGESRRLAAFFFSMVAMLESAIGNWNSETKLISLLPRMPAGLCRADCFRNDIFNRCVDALLLTHEQKKFEDMVNEIYGK